jgi:hypothetical protein
VVGLFGLDDRCRVLDAGIVEGDIEAAVAQVSYY